MKRCPKCHNRLQHNSYCLDCHLQVHYSVEPPNQDSKSPQKATSDDATKSIKKWVPAIIGGFISVLLLILFLLLRNFNSPEAQAKIFVNAVNNGDAAKVATIVSTKDNKVGRQEAARYIEFIKKEMGIKKFEKQVYRHVEKFDEDSPVAYEIKTDNNQKVLRISKNGRRYLIFDNLGFQAPMKKAVVKPNTSATYEFEVNSQKKKVMGKKDETILLGYFIPGDYALDATKKTSRGTYEGQLKFNTGSSDHDTVNVTEDFQEARVKVNIKNSGGLDQDSLKVVINGEKLDVTENQTYGPFPLNKDLTIAAEGKSHGKTFKTATAKIAQADVKEMNEVTVAFNQQEIEKYNKEKEKDVLDKIGDFVKKYTSARKEAFQSHSMNAIEPYLVKDTDLYKAMTTDVKKQQTRQEQSPEVTYVDKTNNFYSVIVQSETEQGNTVQSHYLLQGDDDGKNLKIVNYQAY
ncbi:MAG: teicoplanin resistance protein VanZ [Staphylococcus rostri]|uniref:TcaA NTF2-like domain-containing protein n=1 Tax=Staphylococcus rostri TaxID=522262 RepID=UPI0026E00C55|nr:teicoplanin resistance protein VanZ [Staphylococcus rostri]MDO5375438.1 teicoplanin resistance protein VanZ [Staphylococcus rostri]